MKYVLPLSVLAATVAALPTAAVAQRAPAAAIILVDTDRIYSECTACRTAQTSLQSQVQALRTRQQTLDAQLRPEGTSLQTAVTALAGRAPDAALKARIEAFQKKQQAAQQELGAGEQNIKSIQANVIRQIDAQLRPAINSVMTARGANIAMDLDATLGHGAGIDVTADVLAALNRTLTAVSLTPLPQAAGTQGR